MQHHNYSHAGPYPFIRQHSSLLCHIPELQRGQYFNICLFIINIIAVNVTFDRVRVVRYFHSSTWYHTHCQCVSYCFCCATCGAAYSVRLHGQRQRQRQSDSFNIWLDVPTNFDDTRLQARLPDVHTVKY